MRNSNLVSFGVEPIRGRVRPPEPPERCESLFVETIALKEIGDLADGHTSHKVGIG